MQTLSLLIEKDDVDELLLYTCGYYGVYNRSGARLQCIRDVDDVDEDDVAPGQSVAVFLRVNWH